MTPHYGRVIGLTGKEGSGAAKYHVWRVGRRGPAFLGHVEASDYIAALDRARRAYGAEVEVYLPPARVE